MAEHNLSTKDYAYCEDCKCLFDLWKYDYSLKDAGHEGCKVREITAEELPECIASCEEPIAHCKECGAILDDTPDDTLGHIFYCGLCQKEYTPDEARWENCFGECPGPKDLLCQGCEHLTKVGGDINCSKEGKCVKG